MWSFDNIDMFAQQTKLADCYYRFPYSVGSVSLRASISSMDLKVARRILFHWIFVSLLIAHILVSSQAAATATQDKKMQTVR